MDNDLKLSCIDLFEYLGCCRDLKSALSDYYVKNKNCGILLATDRKDAQVGLLIYEGKTVIEVLYVKALDRFVKTKMLNHLITMSDKVIRYRIVNNEEDEKAALDCGFRYESDLNIYRSVEKDDPNVPVFYERYGKLYHSSMKRNCAVKSFEELNEDELNQIKYNPDNEFAHEFAPGKFLDNGFSDLSKHASTAVIKNGKVVAYSLLRCVGNYKCIFEILCVAKSHRRTFVIVPAIIRSTNELINEGSTRYITFAVHQKNAEMIGILKSDMIRDVIASVTIQHNMIHMKA